MWLFDILYVTGDICDILKFDVLMLNAFQATKVGPLWIVKFY